MSFLTKLRERMNSLGGKKDTPDSSSNKLNDPIVVTTLNGTIVNSEMLENKFPIMGVKIQSPNGLSITILTNENETIYGADKNYFHFIPKMKFSSNADAMFEESPLFVLKYKDEEVMIHVGETFGFISDRNGKEIKSIDYMEGLKEVINWTSSFSNKMFDYLPNQRTKIMSENAFYKFHVPLERINTDFIDTGMAMASVKYGEKLSDVPLFKRSYNVCLESMKAIKDYPERIDNVDYIPNEFLDKNMITTGLENGMPLSKIMPFLQNKNIHDYIDESNGPNTNKVSQTKKYFFDSDDTIDIKSTIDNNRIVSWQSNHKFIPRAIKAFDNIAAHENIQEIDHPSVYKFSM